MNAPGRCSILRGRTGGMKAILVAVALLGFLGCRPAVAQSTPSVNLKASFGWSSDLQSLRDPSLLNPSNLLDQPWGEGYLFQDTFLNADLPLSLSFSFHSRVEWQVWDSAMTPQFVDPTKAPQDSWATILIPSWSLKWVGLRGLLTLGAGKVDWKPAPDRIFRVANVIPWLFQGNAKSMAWIALAENRFAVKAVVAPRAPWVPDLLSPTASQPLPGETLYMTQLQYFTDTLDSGLFGAYDGDYEAGGWLSLPFTDNLIPYAELLYTTKPWIPTVELSEYSVRLQRNNGVRVLAGVLWSPSFVGVTTYLELLYNGDGYSRSDWSALENDLTAINGLSGPYAAIRQGVYGTLAQEFRYGSMACWYAGLHIRPNASLGGVFNWGYTLIYDYPSGLYSELKLELGSIHSVSVSAIWDFPITLATIPGGPETQDYLYSQLLTLSVETALNTQN